MAIYIVALTIMRLRKSCTERRFAMIRAISTGMFSIEAEVDLNAFIFDLHQRRAKIAVAEGIVTRSKCIKVPVSGDRDSASIEDGGKSNEISRDKTKLCSTPIT